MEFVENTDLLDALDTLKKSFGSSGNSEAKELIIDGVASLNGLIDGWAILLSRLYKINELYGSKINDIQRAQLLGVLDAVQKIVQRA